MRDNRPPKFINLVISLECVLLAAFLILLSPVGTVISDSIAVSGQVSEKTGKNGNEESREDGSSGNSKSKKQDFIKWVDFQVTKEAMQQAFRYDVDTCQSDIHLNWIELLAYLGARYGGDFSRYKAADMKTVADRVMGGEKMEDITKDMKYYSYYLEAYGAVLGGMVGEFRVQIPAAEAPEFALEEHREDGKQQAGDGENGGENPNMEDGKPQEKNGDDGKVWVTKYGLKAFSPIARNYPYNDYDDFGAARSYGFKRQHLGHDMMGQVGTPVIAVESGYVEAIGWNQYGGWRLGIRSFDGKRYYYYAHLRKNFPYHKSLREGSVVQAGDVIGYLGRTGYSRTENTNNIDEPHLHFGIQLIFDESQKDGNNEIWIDCYEITRFLAVNRSETVKKQETKEYYRVYQMADPAIPGGPVEQRLPEDEGNDGEPGESGESAEQKAPGDEGNVGKSGESAEQRLPEDGHNVGKPGKPGESAQQRLPGE
ncbi:MAG: M23 family metallopeptidase [Hungatella sp.]|nr:M23 family metallopeptidase [Hungatella sp.]